LARSFQFRQSGRDTAITIGNAAVELNFTTRNRDAEHDALLFFSVRGLSTTVSVKVNNVQVGSLTPNASQTHWFTQMVYMTGHQLKDGTGLNELQLEAVNDSFEIRQVTCFFGRSVGNS
jgi:hypothetical protein